jgi:hypothetical protein
MFGNSNSAVLRRVVPIRSFEDAQKKYESTKPIRGRGDETIRPLSDRSAVDTYSIRKKTDGANNVSYECWMYKTPVITYNENGTIVFDMGSWPSASTRTFISEVAGFPCGIKDGVSYVHVPGIGNVVMPDRGPTAIRFIAGKWELVISMPVFEVQMQRKAANAVRARYKEFIDYVDNVLKLRVEHNKWGTVEIITFTAQEFEDQLKGTLAWGKDWPYLTEPLMKSTDYGRSMADHFLSLVSSDQPESIKTNNFYSAFLLLIAVRKGYHDLSQIQKDVRHPTQCFELRQKLKEVLYRCHNDEVFSVVELPVGKIPNKKYAGWV